MWDYIESFMSRDGKGATRWTRIYANTPGRFTLLVGAGLGRAAAFVEGRFLSTDEEDKKGF
jgi:hypothetical protein